MLSVVTSNVTMRVATDVVLFFQDSRVSGRTRPTPVVAVVGPFILPVRHLSQSRSVRVIPEMIDELSDRMMMKMTQLCWLRKV